MSVLTKRRHNRPGNNADRDDDHSWVKSVWVR